MPKGRHNIKYFFVDVFYKDSTKEGSMPLKEGELQTHENKVGYLLPLKCGHNTMLHEYELWVYEKHLENARIINNNNNN